ncbi:MAG: STAS domain-containing protein [Planctomycetota bacterium]|jgi:anti-sigma B factor antagonist
MIKYTVDERPGALVVRLHGSLDAYLLDFTPDIEKKLRKSKRHLVLDLSGVDFMGSRGMGLLFGLKKVLKDLDRRLAIAAPSRAVSDALGVGGIASLLDIHPGVDEALAACGKPRATRSKRKRAKKVKKARKAKKAKKTKKSERRARH